MCIYYVNETDLTYNSQEHVFPAGLGGIQKLDKGVVSDKANGYFSKLERAFMKKSFTSFNRIVEGPGKRGSLSENKLSTSDVGLFKWKGLEYLGYIDKHGNHLLNQIEIKNEEINLIIDRSTISEKNVFLEKIAAKLKQYYFIPLKDQDSVFITYFNQKVYIASSQDIDLDKISKALERSINNSSTKKETLPMEGDINFNLNITEDIIGTEKVIAKIAINTLAYLMGEEFVKMEEFDELRNAIVSLSDIIEEHVYYQHPKETKKFKNELLFNNKQHVCFFYQDGNCLKALVWIYDRGWEVEMSKHFILDKAIPAGFVCNWTKREEYTIESYYKNEVQTTI